MTEEASHGESVCADASRVIGRLRREHQKLIDLLDRCKTPDNPEQLQQCIAKLSAEVRLHYTIETGVLFSSLAQATRDETMLDDAAKDFAEALDWIAKLSGCSELRVSHDWALSNLHAHLLIHTLEADKENGIFQRAETTNLNWAVVEASLIARRKILVGIFY